MPFTPTAGGFNVVANQYTIVTIMPHILSKSSKHAYLHTRYESG